MHDHHDHEHHHHHHSDAPAVNPSTLDDTQAICPVTGDLVVKAEAEALGHSRTHNGQTYYFCCATCVQLFDKNPEKYTHQTHDTKDCNFVLGDNNGHEIDVHSYTFDADGKNIFGVAYEPRHLTGTGSINGYPVKCIPADVMVEFHSGYELDENDYHDVKALCDRFGFVLPDEYKRFETNA